MTSDEMSAKDSYYCLFCGCGLENQRCKLKCPVCGYQEDSNVARALAELRTKATFLKILGSYPAAVA